MWIWGSVFQLLKWRDCKTQCDNKCWEQGSEYRIRSPFRTKGGQIEVKKFHSVNEYWSWFLTASANDPASNIFDDFRLTGCWNWLLNDPDADQYNELLLRLSAAKELHIPPTKECFDDAPASLVEQLLYTSSELNKAIEKWQQLKNTK